MLKNINCDEQTVYVGYLHDVLEDTDYTYDDLLNKYGKKIADDVLLVSEDQSIEDFKQRKIHFINKIENANKNIALVELADKLQNLLSDYDLFIKDGKKALITEEGNFENLEWYYKKMQKLFNDKLDNNELLTRYNNIMDLYFNK